MASGYSTPGQTYRQTPVIRTQNTELIATVLQAKQGAYDKNLAETEAVLAEYGNIDLARSEDKQYLQEKLSALTSEINNSGMQDLSSSAVTRNIQRHIDQAIDGRVIKQAGNTQKLRKFQQDIQTVKEKKPELYSDANASYAMHEAGLQNYLSGEQDDIGNLEYTPYTLNEANEKIRKALDSNVRMTDGVTKKIPHPDKPGYFLETTVKGLTEEQVRGSVLSQLSSTDLKNLEIQAWSQYKGKEQEVVQSFLKPKVEDIDRQIDSLEINFDSKTDRQKAKDNQSLAYLKQQKESLLSVQNSPQSLFRIIGQEEFIGNLSNEYQPVLTEESLSKDAVAIERLKAQNNSINSAIGYNIDSNGDSIPDVISKTVQSDIPEEERNIKYDEKQQTAIKYNSEQMSNLNSKLYDRLDGEKRTKLDNAYSQYLKENKLTDDTTTKTAFLLEKSHGGKGELFSTEEYLQAKNYVDTQKNELSLRAKAFDKAISKKDAEYTRKLFNTYKEASNFKMKILNKNGEAISAKDFLKGYNSLEELPEDKKRLMLESGLADMTISQTKNFVRGESESDNTYLNSYNIERLARYHGEGGKEKPVLVHPSDVIVVAYNETDFENNFESLKKEMRLPSTLTKDQFKEHILPLVEGSMWNREKGKADVLDFLVPGGYNSTRGLITSVAQTISGVTRAIGARDPQELIIIGGKGTKTRKSIVTALNQGVYDTLDYNDDSVEDDSRTIESLTDRKEVTEDFRNELSKSTPNLASTKTLIVQNSGTREGENIPAFDELMALTDNTSFDKKRPLYVEDTNDGYYSVYQKGEKQVLNKDKEWESKPELVQAKVLKEDLVGGHFNQFVDQSNQQQYQLTTETTDEYYTNNITYPDENTDTKHLAELNKLFWNGKATSQQLSSLTKQGAKQMLENKHPKLFKGAQAEIARDLKNRLIDNADIFKIKLENNSGEFVLKVVYPGENGKYKTLKAIRTQSDNLTSSKYQFDIMEQKFFTEYVDRLLEEIEKDPSKVQDQLDIIEKILYPDA